MKLKDIMTKNVEVVHPDDTLKEAAQKMRVRDIGFLPVYEGGRVVGVVTDRDLILRATAEGENPNTRIGQQFITTPVVSCYDDDSVEEAAKQMEEHQVRRLIVLSHED